MSGKTFSGQTPESRARANNSSHQMWLANKARREANQDIDWDAAILSIDRYFAKRSKRKQPNPKEEKP